MFMESFVGRNSGHATVLYLLNHIVHVSTLTRGGRVADKVMHILCDERLSSQGTHRRSAIGWTTHERGTQSAQTLLAR